MDKAEEEEEDMDGVGGIFGGKRNASRVLVEK
jgi:hypothetical protein